MAKFKLSPGVLVDADRGEAYLMSPQGGIVAVTLASGHELWRSDAAAKPLALTGALLVAQAETPGPQNTLKIVTLDVAGNGGRVAETFVPMPPGVQPMVEPSVNRSFRAEAEPIGAEAAVSWEFVEQPLRGMPPVPPEVLPGEAPPAMTADAAPGITPLVSLQAPPGGFDPDAPLVVRGLARVDPASGAVTLPAMPLSPLAADAAPPVSGARFARASDIPDDQALPNVPQPQFLSADGRHVLSSVRVANDPEWQKYRWRIYEIDTRKLIAEMPAHVRYSPFFVDADRVIFQTLPYARRVKDSIVDEPLQVRAADANGTLLWTQPVRDTTDDQPLPP